MDIKTRYHASLEAQSVETMSAAKRAANSSDTAIWELPSGNFIAMPAGPCVPAGSIRIAVRSGCTQRWKHIDFSEYEGLVSA